MEKDLLLNENDPKDPQINHLENEHKDKHDHHHSYHESRSHGVGDVHVAQGKLKTAIFLGAIILASEIVGDFGQTVWRCLVMQGTWLLM